MTSLDPDYVAVPREPTEEMVQAGVRSVHGEAVYKCVSGEGTLCMEADMVEAYRAMLAAVPAAPKPTEGQSTALVERLRIRADGWGHRMPSSAEEIREAADRIEALEAALRELRLTHYACEDCWYSCPKSSDGCCNEAQGNECNCGADKHNAIIDRLLGSKP